MSEWNVTTLGLLSKKKQIEIRTGPFGSQLHQSDYVDNGIPVVMPKDILDWKICTDTIARTSSKMIDKLQVHQLRFGDIVYGRRGDIGRHAFATEKETGYLCGTGCIRLRLLNDAPITPRFLSFYLRLPDTINSIYNQAVGSTMPNLNTSIIENISVNYPKMDTQNKIVSALIAYDKLIENNNRRIAILEEMAQKLYREWFVHFRFPGHENVKMVESEMGLIPEGWNIGVLSDVAGNHKKSVKKDNREKYKCYIPIDCIPKKSLVLSETKSISEAESSLIEFKKNDILMGAMRAYFHKVLCAPCDGLTRSTCFVIRPKDEVYHAYLLMTIFQEQTIEYASTVSVGATMPYVNWDTFAQMQTLIPTSKVALKYNDVLKPIIQQMHNIFYKNANLRRTRDLLPPDSVRQHSCLCV